MYWNYWRFQLHWNKLEWFNTRSKKNKTTLFSFFKGVCIDKDLITANWVGHSLLKELYYNDSFDMKHMIEYLEAERTGASKETSNNEKLAVIEEAKFDEAITSEAKASNNMENDIKD